jgi:hypothetical protein
MSHPLAAYGKALMRQDNKGGTLDPVQPANRHRNVGQQARRILTCPREIRRLWRQRSVKRRLAKKLPPSSFRSGEALWGSSGRFLKRRLASGFQSGGALWESSERFLKRRLAKSGFQSGGALWGSSGRFLKRRLASGFQSGGALWGSGGRFLKRGLPGKLAPNNFRDKGAL